MTTVDVVYRFGAQPTEAAAQALGSLREVYGIRRVDLSEAAKTVTVEYDSTRLTVPIIQNLLRRTGLDVGEHVRQYTDPPPPPPPASPSA